jgi:hypothetical protein
VSRPDRWSTTDTIFFGRINSLAGIAADFAKSSAGVRAHQLRRRPHVAEAISKALGERLGATRSGVLEEISRLAFSNITALRCSAASISICEYGIGCQEQTSNDVACDR